MRLSTDTETTGVDLRHAATPFLVTFCDEEFNNTFFEWDVNPLTREVKPPKEDIEEIIELLESADEIVLQNSKFDVTGFLKILPKSFKWPWHKTWDTLLNGHLLASNHLHDLTTMAIEYLGVDVSKYESTMKTAVDKCRSLVRRKGSPFSDWFIAKAGAPGMPSVKEKAWKNDLWLPRAIWKWCIDNDRLDLLPDEPHLPIVGRIEKCDVRIDRRTIFGNPYRRGLDGDRNEVIHKFAKALINGRLPHIVDHLGDLHCKTIGCHCSPDPCHGDILRGACHSWATVTSEYANSDSATTIALHLKQLQHIEKRKLDKIAAFRQKLLPVVHRIESRGITLSEKRLNTLMVQYKADSKKAGELCVGIAKNSYGYDLTLPKGATNNSLHNFVYDVMKMPVVTRSKKTGKPELNKKVIEHWQATLPPRSKQYRFISTLRGKRQRDTAITYMEGYKRFWKNYRGDIKILYPSLNPTGTDTLRFSSNNPNEQNISKQEGFNLRYAFGPAEGREWWALDAKNIELRLPAYESGEQELIDLFERPNEPPYYGSTHLLNFHTVYPDIWDKEFELLRKQFIEEFGVAKADEGFQYALSKVGPHCKKKFESTWYQWCKNGGFAVQYGAVEQEGGQGTADQAFHRAGSHAKLKARFSKLDELNQQCINQAERYGYVETIPDNTVDPERGYPLLCERGNYGKIKPTIPLNYHIQGSAMWWMCQAMIRCQDQLDSWRERKVVDAHIICQVHDELVFDFPWKKNKGNLPKVLKLKSIAEQGGNGFGIPTPVSVTYIPENWAEGETVR